MSLLEEIKKRLSYYQHQIDSAYTKARRTLWELCKTLFINRAFSLLLTDSKQQEKKKIQDAGIVMTDKEEKEKKERFNKEFEFLKEMLGPTAKPEATVKKNLSPARLK